MITTAIGELESLDSIETLWSRTIALLAGEGLDFAIYITVAEDYSAPFVMTNVPKVYDAQDPATDPFLSHCCRSYDITATGPDFLPDYDYLPDAAKRFIRDARATGFRTGLGIPMRMQGSARFGGFNIGSRLAPDAFNAQIWPRREEFRFFCLLVHRRIEELMRDRQPLATDGFRDLLVAPAEPQLEALSPREREVIYLVTQGVSRKECARLCGISPNTVAEYTKSAYRKLGVQNRVEAARLLLRRTG